MDTMGKLEWLVKQAKSELSLSVSIYAGAWFCDMNPSQDNDAAPCAVGDTLAAAIGACFKAAGGPEEDGDE